MNDTKVFKINYGVINGGIINQSTVCGINVNGDINWDELKYEIRELSSKYCERYNNSEDMKYIEDAEKIIDSKDKNKLNDLICKFPTMLKAFIKELGLSLLTEFVLGKIT